MPLNLTLAERIEKRSIKVRRGRWVCIESTYARTPQGYAHMRFEGRDMYVHRATYELAKGPIPKGMTLDHRCRNRACRKLQHLRVMTGVENVMLGEAPPAKNARKTHCSKGHPLSGENLLLHKGNGRRCRTCRNAWQRAYMPDWRATRSAAHPET